MIAKLLDLLAAAFAAVQRFFDWLNQEREDGRREADAAHDRALQATLRRAEEARRKAEEEHAKKDDDGAFDKDFWRD